MGLLDEIIDGATSDTVSTSNLLRKVQVIARRIGSDELTAWVLAELNGFDSADALPAYRGPLAVHVRGTYSGPFGSSATAYVSKVGTPDSMEYLFEVSFRSTLAEIEDLARSDDEIGNPWDSAATAYYNRLIEANRVPHPQGMLLFFATRVVSKGLLVGIVDSVRTRALELALDLQAANPAAGEVDGPTRTDRQIAQVVNQFTTNVYGDGANVAQGNGTAHQSSVTNGDIAGLVEALTAILQERSDVNHAVSVITAPEDEPKKRRAIERLGAALRDGGTAVAAGVTSDVAADRLLALAHQFLGW